MNKILDKYLKSPYNIFTRVVLNTILKRVADASEKMSVGGVLVAAFENKSEGFALSAIWFGLSLILSVLEAKTR